MYRILALQLSVAAALTAATLDESIARLAETSVPWHAGERVVLIGDSVADGTTTRGWAVQVRDALAKARPDLRVEALASGWQRVASWETWAKDDADAEIGLAVVMLGHVDLIEAKGADGKPVADWKPPAATSFQVQVMNLVGALRRNGTNVVLVTPAVSGDKTDGTNPHDALLDSYAEGIRTEAGEPGITLCDLRKACLAELATRNAAGKASGVFTGDKPQTLTQAGSDFIAARIAEAMAERMQDPAWSVRLDNGLFLGQHEVAIGLRHARNPADIEIRYSTDGKEPTDKAKVYAKPFTIRDTTTVLVLASDKAGGRPQRAAAVLTKTKLRPDEKLGAPSHGVDYEYLAARYGKIPAFDTIATQAKGTLSGIDLALLRLEPGVAGRAEDFAVRWLTWLQAPADGVYTFAVTSDDGSKLYIGDEVVLDNDGGHGPRERRGQIALKAGFHPFVLDYFQATGGSTLTVRWQAEGTRLVPLTDLAFWRDAKEPVPRPKSATPIPAPTPAAKKP